MCGFVGCFHASGGGLDVPALRRMLAAVKHRGPDDEGLHGMSFRRGSSLPLDQVSEARELEGGFGFARLSIQDLSAAGHQPMTSADGKVVLVFNGEIYNAGEHRDTLCAQGVEFRGHSDTEVILRLYERHGWEGVLERLEGMYALAIADLDQGCLRVARDPFGIKPLYYWQQDGVLLFASETKAFYQHPAFRAEVETEHLAEQLLFRYTAWDRTLLRGVMQLPPGHALEWRADGSLARRRFWSLPDAEEGEVDLAHLRATLRRSVESQLVSDVPLGTQLSGGIDSSLVTLDAARASGAKLHTYSVVFEDARVSEDVWMDVAARKAGVHGHRLFFTASDFVSSFEKAVWHLDGPAGNPNTLAIYQLAEEAKQRVKVLLTGEGCDELFAGYNRYYYTALQQAWPGVFRAVGRLAGRQQGRWWRLFGQAGATQEHQMVISSAYGASGLVENLLPGVNVNAALEARLDHLSGIPGHGVRRQVRYEVETYLPDLLLRQDKMTMAHGIECRVPFLDTHLAAAARKLPLSWLAQPFLGRNARMRGTKRAIKSLAQAEFGHAFAYRRKCGFDVPLGQFFRHPEVRAKAEEEWLPAMREDGLLDSRTVLKEWQNILDGKGGVASAETLWVAFGLSAWKKVFRKT